MKKNDSISRPLKRGSRLAGFLITLLSIAAAGAMAVIQFFNLYQFKGEEISSVMLILLLMMSVTFMLERFSIFQEILERLDRIERKQEGEVKPPEQSARTRKTTEGVRR